jgi:effector-binding domain-containing protein
MKKIIWAALFLLLGALTYYFFIRSFEFEVNFKASTQPGDVIETIRLWNNSLDGAKVVEVDSFASLTQVISRNGREYLYRWNFLSSDDSVTKVNIQISEPERTLLNKLLVPFSDQEIEKDADEIVRGFYDVLKAHLEITRVNIVGESELDSSLCVCRELETNQVDKARGMMRDYSLLTSFIADHGLKTEGRPSVRIMTWNHSKGALKFDFCFPISGEQELPSTQAVVYKKFEKIKVLKAEYYGNYITSDRAWYELINYARKMGYKVDALPIEVFHDNPNLGMNEQRWKADVYLRINE